MIDVIDKNDFYSVLDETHFCCDELQFRYVCHEHDEYQGCYYCEFDYNKECECE